MNEKKESQCMCLQQAESQRVPASFVHMHQGVALLRDLALLPVSSPSSQALTQLPIACSTA